MNDHTRPPMNAQQAVCHGDDMRCRRQTLRQYGMETVHPAERRVCQTGKLAGFNPLSQVTSHPYSVNWKATFNTVDTIQL